MAKYEEKELKDLGVVGGKYKARVIESPKGIVLDIREHIESPTFTGFTKKGIRLNKEGVESAIAVFQEALKEL